MDISVLSRNYFLSLEDEHYTDPGIYIASSGRYLAGTQNQEPDPQFRRRSCHYLRTADSFFLPHPTPIGETMSQPAPALPTSRRDTRGQACVKSLLGIKRRTGVSMPKHLLLKMAFDAGYEAGAEDVGSGELLVETLDLRYALYDLDGKTKAGCCARRPGNGPSIIQRIWRDPGRA